METTKNIADMISISRSFWRYIWGNTQQEAPPKKLTDKAWREPFHWNAELEKSLLGEIKNSPPMKIQEQEKTLNLLVMGPVNAGKSSFISSVLSIDKGRKCMSAITGNRTRSCTVDLAAFSKGDLLKGFRIFDCMGFELDDGEGFHIDDLIFLINGNISKGYTFNPRSPITKEHQKFRQNPKFEDQMHCVVFVVSAVTIVEGLPKKYLGKLNDLQDKLRQMKIPSILVLTKVDALCDEVAKDIKKMFWSIKVYETVKKANEMFGIETATIHPVKNYHDDFNIKPEKNIPILLALRQAMQFAVDKVEYEESNARDD